MFTPPVPVAAAKLAAPRLDVRAVVRTRLVEQLCASRSPLIAIVAPAGYGKTTLATQVAAHLGGTTAWLRLDSGDDEPARFWSGVAVGLAAAGLPGTESVHELLANGGDDALRVPDVVRAAIDAHDGPLTLVLDDVHALTDDRITEALTAWLQYPSDRFVMVATSRHDLPLPVGRLRSQGLLAEARLDDLAFDDGETESLLASVFGVGGLNDSHREALRNRTNGWPVGVYLAGLALRDGEDLDATLARFTGDTRHLSEYLTTEATDGLDDDARAFLLSTSILRVLSPDLCDTVTGQPGSLRILRRLVAEHVFTEALDDAGTMFQYHPLFREHLHSTLLAEHPGSVAELHLRASEWSEDHGMVDDAVRHAIRGDHVERAQRLIADSWLLFSRTGHFGTFEGWVRALGDHAEESTEICLMMTWSALNMHRWADVDVWLDRAAAAAQDDVHEQMVTVEGPVAKAMARRHLGDVGRYLALASSAMERFRDDLDIDDPDIAERILTMGPLAEAALGAALFWHGDHDEARSRLHSALMRARALRERTSSIDAYLHLAMIEAEVGDPDDALAHGDQALAMVEPSNELFIRPTLGHLAKAIAHRRLGRPADATASLDEARRIVTGAAEPLHAALIELEQARIEHLNGDLPAARAALRAAEAIADELPDPQLDDRIRATRTAIRFVPREVEGLPAGARELTDREAAVLALLPHDLSRKELASQLFVSENTVKTHLSSIRHKLGIEGRASIVDRARELGLLSDET